MIAARHVAERDEEAVQLPVVVKCLACRRQPVGARDLEHVAAQLGDHTLCVRRPLTGGLLRRRRAAGGKEQRRDENGRDGSHTGNYSPLVRVRA